MIRKVFSLFLIFVQFIFGSPIYASDISTKTIEKYNQKISNKFAKTYCNTIQFGISYEGALKFSIGETNKEFSNNKLNQFIDEEFLKKNILVSLENNCEIYDFSLDELGDLVFN